MEGAAEAAIGNNSRAHPNRPLGRLSRSFNKSMMLDRPVVFAVFDWTTQGSWGEWGEAARCQFERALKERLDDRWLRPVFVHEAHAGFFDQPATPVVSGDFVERRQTQTVRQTQVIEP